MALRRKARTKSSKASSAPASSAAKAAIPSAGIVAQLSDPKNLRRLLLAAKVVGPAVAAGAMKSATTVRGALDERRARQLGVPVDEVAAYAGPTGPVQARIAGLTKAVNDLDDRRGGNQAVGRFVGITGARLQELSAAVAATHSMPSTTRRSALRAISADLDQLDAELMTLLVGPPTASGTGHGRPELTS